MGSCLGMALKCKLDQAVYCLPNAVIRDTIGIVSWETSGFSFGITAGFYIFNLKLLTSQRIW